MAGRALLALLALWFSTVSSASGATAAPPAAPAPAPQYQIYPMSGPVRVGNLQYSLKRAYWFPVRQEPKNETVEYLAIRLRVRNLGGETVQIPPFKIFDSEAGLYEPNYAKLVFPKMSLRAAEEEEGLVLFLPPKGRSYWFIASSDYASAEFALVALDVR